MHGSGNPEERAPHFMRRASGPLFGGKASVNFGWPGRNEVGAAIVTVWVLLALASGASTGAQAAENLTRRAKDDVQVVRELETRMNTPVISVAGDLLGHVVGTVSRAEGTVAVKDASIEITGKTPAGAWASTAKSDEQGLFKADLPLASVGPIRITATGPATKAALTLDRKSTRLNSSHLG